VCKRRVLGALHDYMDKYKIPLSTMTIEHVDVYFIEYTAFFSPRTCHHYRSVVRGFLKYLYLDKRILKRDLASLLASPPVYTQARPPKFYRKEEIQKLFQSIDTSTAKGLRTYAFCILAYTLGLRPKEISLIRLDDILFTDGTLILTKRKGANPMKLPLPEETLKAIAAYIIGGRPKSRERKLFLTFRAPYYPVTAGAVSASINATIGEAKIFGSAYWLRHTYAQNLLESGASIFEIKQMLGHESIQSSKRYIHIHTKLMREVMFDEIL
jgi:site-specific recombinase XerD